MLTATISELRRQLTDLVELAEQGEEVVITRQGKPIARLAPPRTAFGEKAPRERRPATSPAPNLLLSAERAAARLKAGGEGN